MGLTVIRFNNKTNYRCTGRLLIAYIAYIFKIILSVCRIVSNNFNAIEQISDVANKTDVWYN
jgi:hypothetical protein